MVRTFPRDLCCDDAHLSRGRTIGQILIPPWAEPRLLGRGAIVALAAAAITALAWPFSPTRGTLVWNHTPSVPVGLYRIASVKWSRGDLVAVKPSKRLAGVLSDVGVLEPGRLLLKRIVAVAGDMVCRRGLWISVNGVNAALALAADAKGKGMPAWTGCQLLEKGEVFLLGEHPASFDGRYFGPSRAADIIGRITPVLVLRR